MGDLPNDAEEAHLEDLIAAVVAEFGIEMAEDSLRYATRHHLDAIRPHIEHDPEAERCSEPSSIVGSGSACSPTLCGPRSSTRPAGGGGAPGSDRRRLYTSHMEYTKPQPAGVPCGPRGLGIRIPAAPFSWVIGRTTTSRRSASRPKDGPSAERVGPSPRCGAGCRDRYLPGLSVVDGWMRIADA